LENYLILYFVFWKINYFNFYKKIIFLIIFSFFDFRPITVLFSSSSSRRRQRRLFLPLLRILRTTAAAFPVGQPPVAAGVAGGAVFFTSA
jgi:hypothetical protein